MLQQQFGRYAAACPATAAEGWSVERLTPPSRLFGANGIAAGPDGRIYVAQVSGSQISAIDPEDQSIETISALGGAIVAPDDLAFDEAGNLYATEITEGRVCRRAPNGQVDIIYGDVPVANPITFFDGQLITGECRPGGRIVALDRHGDGPRTIVENVPMANAFAVGPDRMLYFPVMGTNEIWRVNPAGGEPEVVAGNLGVPTAVKFDAEGFIVSTQGASGQVLRIDPRSGGAQVLAQLDAGLDNLCFVNGRLFVSNMIGSLTEIGSGGAVSQLVSGGMNWPLGLAVADDGVFVADGAFSYALTPGQEKRCVGNLFSPGYPGYVRGVAYEGQGSYVVTTGMGHVMRFHPGNSSSEVLSAGFEQLYGIAIGADGDIFVVDKAQGSIHAVRANGSDVIAAGLAQPKDVTIHSSGRLFVSEAAGGRIVELTGRGSETLVDDLGSPEGIAFFDDDLYIVDASRKELVCYNLETGTRSSVVSDLPVGAPEGVEPKFIGPIGSMSGPMGSFAAIAIAADGTLYISGDAEGSVLAVRSKEVEA